MVPLKLAVLQLDCLRLRGYPGHSSRVLSQRPIEASVSLNRRDCCEVEIFLYLNLFLQNSFQVHTYWLQSFMKLVCLVSVPPESACRRLGRVCDSCGVREEAARCAHGCRALHSDLHLHSELVGHLHWPSLRRSNLQQKEASRNKIGSHVVEATVNAVHHQQIHLPSHVLPRGNVWKHALGLNGTPVPERACAKHRQRQTLRAPSSVLQPKAHAQTQT